MWIVRPAGAPKESSCEALPKGAPPQLAGCAPGTACLTGSGRPANGRRITGRGGFFLLGEKGSQAANRARESVHPPSSDLDMDVVSTEKGTLSGAKRFSDRVGKGIHQRIGEDTGHARNSCRAVPAPAGGELQPPRGGRSAVHDAAVPMPLFYPISCMISSARPRSRSA
jgi:hypothetical protein